MENSDDQKQPPVDRPPFPDLDPVKRDAPEVEDARRSHDREERRQSREAEQRSQPELPPKHPTPRQPIVADRSPLDLRHDPADQEAEQEPRNLVEDEPAGRIEVRRDLPNDHPVRNQKRKEDGDEDQQPPAGAKPRGPKENATHRTRAGRKSGFHVRHQSKSIRRQLAVVSCEPRTSRALLCAAPMRTIAIASALLLSSVVAPANLALTLHTVRISRPPQGTSELMHGGP